MLASGADQGVAFAGVMQRFLDLEPLLLSTRTADVLADAAERAPGDWPGVYRHHLELRGQSAEPAGGTVEAVMEVVAVAADLSRALGVVLSALRARPQDLALMKACRNELGMMAVFATRAARTASIPPPTASDLAALALWIGLEKDARTVEEKERRVDKFRKVLAKLPTFEAAVDALLAPR